MADAPDLGSGGAILRGSSPLPGTSSGLAAVFKEKHLGSSVRKIESDSAVAADQIARDTATGAHAVNLVNAGVGADVKFAPRFDQRGSLRLVGEEKLQGRAFVLKIAHPRRRFDRPIIEAGRFH